MGIMEKQKENEYPEHGVYPTDLETRGGVIDHREP
jgi:hypothetical protein